MSNRGNWEPCFLVTSHPVRSCIVQTLCVIVNYMDQIMHTMLCLASGCIFKGKTDAFPDNKLSHLLFYLLQVLFKQSLLVIVLARLAQVCSHIRQVICDCRQLSAYWLTWFKFRFIELHYGDESLGHLLYHVPSLKCIESDGFLKCLVVQLQMDTADYTKQEEVCT